MAATAGATSPEPDTIIPSATYRTTARPTQATQRWRVNRKCDAHQRSCRDPGNERAPSLCLGQPRDRHAHDHRVVAGQGYVDEDDLQESH